MNMINLLSTEQDDAPGDPELGGWRPLPKDFFSKQIQKRIVVILPINLKHAVNSIAFQMRYLNLTNALENIAKKLKK